MGAKTNVQQWKEVEMCRLHHHSQIEAGWSFAGIISEIYQKNYMNFSSSHNNKSESAHAERLADFDVINAETLQIKVNDLFDSHVVYHFSAHI